MPEKKDYASPTDEKAIGGALRDARRKRGITQKELADKLEMDQSVLSRYERGQIRVHGALLATFAKALGVSSDEILGLQKTKEQPTIKDRRFLRRLHQIDGLPRRQKDALLTTIDALLKSKRAS